MKAVLLLLAVPFLLVAEDTSRIDSPTGEKCLVVLREGLRSDDFWPAIHAAEALTLAGETDEVRAFLAPLLEKEKDTQKRCGIARELVRAGEIEKATIMLDLLRSDDAYAHSHAAESLYKVGYPGEGAPVRERFATTEDTRLKLMSAAAIAKHEDGAIREEAYAFLREQLETNADPEYYKVAAWVLGRIGDADDIPRLRAREKDAKDSPLTLAYLHHSLALLGDEAGRAETARNLDSDDPDVRTYAATFAGEANLTEAIPQLIRQLDDPDLDARIRAAQALVVLSDFPSR